MRFVARRNPNNRYRAARREKLRRLSRHRMHGRMLRCIALALVWIVLVVGCAALAVHWIRPDKEDSGAQLTGIAYDTSLVDQGIIGVGYKADDSILMVRIQQSGGYTETLPMDADGEYDYYPLTGGSGKYAITVYKNVSGNNYAQLDACSVTANMESDYSYSLYPNKYCWFGEDSACVAKSAELCAGLETDKDKITAIWKYVCGKIAYDYIQVLTTVLNYVPDPDTTLSTRKGICFDIASLMTALLRAQDIPAELVVGTVVDTGEYHAWCKVLVGDKWLVMDPTYATTGNGENYIEEHFY